jgi:hypothetical protein
MSRDEIIATFGEPELQGGTSRKYRTPCIFRYGRVEFMFAQWKSGGLEFVHEVDEFGDHVRTLIPRQSQKSR